MVIQINLKEFVEKLVKNSLMTIKDRPQYRDFVLEKLDSYEKKKLWENFKYTIAPVISSFYGEQFPEIDKIFYGDIAAGEWIQIEEQSDEKVTGADLDLLIIVSDNHVIPVINKLMSKLDSYFLETLKKDSFAAERLGHNFLELHINDNYARQAEKDPGSCGACLVYEKLRK